MRSAPTVRYLLGEKKKKPTCHPSPLRAETCCQPPCVQSELRHVLFCRPPARDGQGQMRCGGPPREQASARLSSSMGALMNAASSVLPMVRSPPLQLQKPLLSVYRVFCFLAHGGHGGHFPFPTRNNKAFPVCVCVCVCVCCLCIAGAGVCSLARPLTPNRCTPLRAAGLFARSRSIPPAPWGRRPGLVYVPCLASLRPASHGRQDNDRP